MSTSLFKSLSLTFILTLLAHTPPSFSVEDEPCLAALSDDLLTTAEYRRFEDTNFYKPVVFSQKDQSQLVKSFDIDLRPDFALVVIKTEDPENSLIGLVPKKADGSTDYVGQQVVQWQRLDIDPILITGIESLKDNGNLTLTLVDGGWFAPSRFKTKIVVSKPLKIHPESFEKLAEKMKLSPKIHMPEDKPTPYRNLIRFLFGKAWVQIFGGNGEYNALRDSQDLLTTRYLIDPYKEKNLHVVGSIFTAELSVNADSPFSGFLSPGRYHILGRLSSGMKNLRTTNEQGQLEPNSLAIGLLLFKTKDQEEEPGLLLLQDSLVPVVNPGLMRYALSNNPGFAFKPTTIREFFEQGFTIAGVALASFLNKIDSGRGLQASFRSNQGAASHGVQLDKGETVHSPRYLAIHLKALFNRHRSHHVHAIREDSNAYFEVQYSENGRDWQKLGRVENINWFGSDSHQLTFPHGLSGGINPNTLIPNSGNAGIKGLQLPIGIRSLDQP